MPFELQYAGSTQTCAHALQHLVQAVAFLNVFQQQTGGFTGQFFSLQCAQVQVQHGSGQSDFCQMFADQPLQVHDVLCGLCGAYD